MRHSSTERGLSEVLGAILMFALVFAVLVIIQVWAVPTANAQIELQHSQQLDTEYGELAETLGRVGISGAESTVSIDAGVRYPSRLFLINPPPAGYTFTSNEGQSIGLANVHAVDDETDDFLNEGTNPVSYSTVSFTHVPSYNIYENAPSYRIENGVVYKAFPNGETRFVSHPNIVDGRRITLTVLDGSISEGGSGSLALSVSPVSAGKRTVAVTHDVSEPDPVISIYTEVSENKWKEALEGEIDGSNGDPNRFIDDIACRGQADEDADLPCNGILDITLETGKTYDLTVTKLAIGNADSESVPTYVTKVGENKPTISADGTEITVEVRDQFNNPMSGEEVRFQKIESESSDDGSLSDSDVITDENGRASVIYTPDTGGDVTIYAGLDKKPSNGNGLLTDEDAQHIVQYNGLTTDVSTKSSDKVPFDINSGELGSVVLNEAVLERGSSSENYYATIEFYNRNETVTKTVQEARINFFGAGAISRGGEARPTAVELGGPDGEAILGIQKEFETVNIMDLGPGDREDLRFEFRQSDGARYALQEGDFFVFTFIYTDGTSSLYIAGPLVSPTSQTDIEYASASSLSGHDPQTQTFEIYVGDDISASNPIVVDLSAADGNKGLTYNSVDSTSSGSAEFTASHELTFTPGTSLAKGDKVTITVTVDPDDNINQATPFTVSFTGPDGESFDDEFTVVP